MSNSLTPEQKLARLKCWLDFLKFFLGSVAVVALSTILGHLLKERELQLKAAEQKSQLLVAETDNLGKYIEKALAEDLKARIRFAEYFADLTSDDQARVRWTAYYKSLQEQQKVIDKLEAEKAQAAAAAKIDSSLTAEFAKISTQLDAAKAAALPLANSADFSPGKVNIFAARSEDVPKIAKMLGTLKSPNFNVGRLRQLNDDSRPLYAEIRYFNSADTSRAAELSDLVEGATGLSDVQLKQLEDSSIKKPGYFELWIPADVLSNSTAPGRPGKTGEDWAVEVGFGAGYSTKSLPNVQKRVAEAHDALTAAKISVMIIQQGDAYFLVLGGYGERTGAEKLLTQLKDGNSDLGRTIKGSNTFGKNPLPPPLKVIRISDTFGKLMKNEDGIYIGAAGAL